MWVGAYSIYISWDLLHTMSYIVFCTLKLLSPKDLTHISHILNERISYIPYKKLVEKKNTLKHFELNVDRDGIKEGKAVKTVVRAKY